MTYDHWKTTEPESRYDPPDDIDDEGTYEDGLNRVKDIARQLKVERDRAIGIIVRYEAALRKIAAWKGYAPPSPSADYTQSTLVKAYEGGANDMLKTLKQMAEEALS